MQSCYRFPMLGLCLLLFAIEGHARISRSLSFIPAHMLRLSGLEKSEEWLVNHHPAIEVPESQIYIFAALNKEIPNIISLLQKKQKNQLNQKLQGSYGVPYDVEAKAAFLLSERNVIQQISLSAGAYFIVNDPVFLTLEGMLFEDYMMSTSARWNLTEKFKLKLKASYGLRKIMVRNYTVGDLVNKKPNLDFDALNWQFLADLSSSMSYDFNGGTHLFYDAQQLPLTGRDHAYWSTTLGVRSPNMSSLLGGLPTVWKAYASYSPTYGGDYEVKRTIQFGTFFNFGKWLSLEAFTLDFLLPGARLALALGPVELSFYTFERAYNDTLDIKSRQYGTQFKLAF